MKTKTFEAKLFINKNNKQVSMAFPKKELGM